MKSRREQLLGYLLGALDAAESRQVEAELDQNPALRVEMARLEPGTITWWFPSTGSVM